MHGSELRSGGGFRTWIRVRQETTQAQNDLLQAQRRRPVVLEDVEADRARVGDVAVVDLGLELESRGGEGVVGRELDVDLSKGAHIGDS